MKKQMTVRERFQAISNFRPFDRLPVVEWAPWWDKTIERWHAEGLPKSCADRYDICRYFDQDVYVQEWPRGVHWECPYNEPSHGAGIFETAGEDIEKIVPYLGRWPVFEERIRPFVKQHESGDHVFWFTVDGFFWLPRGILGIERHLYAFYDQPDIIHRINRIQADWICRYVDALCKIIKPDFMTFAEDMSYNNGSMLSKDLFDEFMKPYYQMVIPKLKERGIKVIIDSDGDISVPNSWFEEAGIEGILPLERQAGVDVAQLRREHPRQIYIGAYDKMVMNKGEAAMRQEFERLLPVAQKGGFLISCDHQTPPGVSFDDYNLYLGLFREYAEKAGSL